MMKKKNIFIVGDSLMMELADSLDFMTGLSVDAFKTWVVLNPKTLQPASIEESEFCSCMERSALMRGIVENYVEEDKMNCWKEKYSKIWKGEDEWKKVCHTPPDPNDKMKWHLSPSFLRWVESFDKYDTFVFSVGHHSWKFGDDLDKVYPVLVHRTIEWLEKKVLDGWNGWIIYVAAPMGHKNCQNYTEPIIDFPQTGNIWDKYGWAKTVRLQQMWRISAEKSDILRNRFVFLDLEMMKYRPEGHYEGIKMDCLHWMLPGPVDTWSHLFFHVLKEIEDSTVKE